MARIASAPTTGNYASVGLFVFRVVAGLLFTLHGTVKLFGWPPGAGSTAQFGAWPSWWAGLIEAVAGLLLISGLFTRAAAFIASGTMAVAYFWRHQPDGLLPIQNGGESAALYCFAFLLLALAGGGAWALDNLLGRRSASADQPQDSGRGRENDGVAGR